VSSARIRQVMTVITVLGLGVAIFLTIVHYGGLTVPCTTKHNSCAQVQSSVYSEVVGIPVALLGLIGYAAILVTLLAPDLELSRLATLGFTLFGFGFSAYLTYREVFTLKLICEWCVGSAVLMTVLFVLAIVRYLSGPSQPPVLPR
jgi:uncharacterized membrane protein